MHGLQKGTGEGGNTAIREHDVFINDSQKLDLVFLNVSEFQVTPHCLRRFSTSEWPLLSLNYSHHEGVCEGQSKRRQILMDRLYISLLKEIAFFKKKKQLVGYSSQLGILKKYGTQFLMGC